MTHNNHSTQRPSGRDPRGDLTEIVAAESNGQLRQCFGPTTAHSSNPEYGRLPAPGQRDPLTGLSRTTLSELVLPCSANGFKPPVRSVLLKKRGASRGIRLIHVPSLLEHLGSLAEETFASGQGNSTDTDR
jgi:hypothetical protein